MIDEEDSNFLQDCLEAHGYVHSDCESDEGKSESDDELCRIKPPPIPYEEFQHKVIQIGKVYPVPSTSNAIPGSGTHLFLPNYLSQKDINLEMKKPYLVWQLPPQIILVPAPLVGFSCGGPTNGHLHPSAPGGVPYSIYGTPLIASGEFGNSTGNFVALNGRIGLTSNTSSSDLEGSGFGNSRIGENNGGYDIRATPSHSGCFDSIKEDGSNTIPTQPDGASFGDIGKPSTSDVPSPHHSKTS